MTSSFLLLLMALPAQSPTPTLWSAPKPVAVVKVDVAQQKMLEAVAELAMRKSLEELVVPEPPAPDPEPQPQPAPQPMVVPVAPYPVIRYYYPQTYQPTYVQPPVCLPGR